MAYVNLKELSFEAFSHIEKHEFQQAENKLSYLLNIYPNDPVLIYYLGCLFLESKRYGMAIVAYERCLTLSPDFDECLNNMSTAYRQCGDIETCIKYFRKAIEIARTPEYKARFKEPSLADRNLSDYLGNLGSCFIARGQPNHAMQYFDEALKLNPGSQNVLWNQGLAYLELGDYEKGFIGYDCGERVSPEKERSYHGGAASTPWWPGRGTKTKTGDKPTVVVYGEQGIGDEIMFASIIPDMMKEANVILECHPRLMDIFRQTWPELTIYGTRKAIEVNWAKNEKIDYKIAIGSLAKHFRKKKEDFPGTPFLKANPKLVEKMREKCNMLDNNRRKPKIGISWKGGIGITNKAPRCIPLETLQQLTHFDADFISLQYHNNAQHEVDVFNEQIGATVIHHWQDVVDDYDLTAALLMNLNLVISVPQSVVHLAGALGVQTIQMCPVEALWQMGPYKENMPWYNSVQNFWQLEKGNWGQVVEHVFQSMERDGYKCI